MDKAHTVIKIEKKHLHDIVNLEKQCFPTPWGYEQFEMALSDTHTELYGVENNNEIIAYLLCSVVGDYAEILNIATLPQYRKQGCGKALLSFWLSQEHMKNIHVVLEVRAKNIPAQNLYSQFGFKQIHIRKNYYADDDALVMER